MAPLRFAVTAVALSILTISAWGAEHPEPAQQLIQDVVYNELHNHDAHGYWEYMVQKRVGEQVTTEQRVETKDGQIHRMIAMNGELLSASQQHEEEIRLDQLMQDPGQQRRMKQQYEEDEQKIGRILKLLPEAFLYEYEASEGDTLRLKFHPNPAFSPHTIEARIFHSMAGTIWVSNSQKHLVRLHGTLIEDIEFGFGILGRLNKGGWFNMERVQVSATDWKTDVLEIHITGKAIFFKTIAKDTHEIRSDFHEVPRDTSISQAKFLLEQEQTQNRLKLPEAVMRTSLLSGHP